MTSVKVSQAVAAERKRCADMVLQSVEAWDTVLALARLDETAAVDVECVIEAELALWRRITDGTEPSPYEQEKTE